MNASLASGRICALVTPMEEAAVITIATKRVTYLAENSIDQHLIKLPEKV